MPRKSDLDVVILGAGPGGCATALALLRAGIERVAIIDKPVRTPFRIGESATPDVTGLLNRLGLSSDLAQLGHRPCHGTLSLWGGQRTFDDFLRRGKGHGWHLDRGAFDLYLRHQATERGAHLVAPATIAAVTRAPGGWTVDLDTGETVTARVVVDAAGRRSPLATRLGATRHQLDELVALAVMAAPAPEGGLGGSSLVEPFEDGWWYAALLPSGQAMVTLMTDNDMARSLDLRQPARYRRAWDATTELKRLVPPPDILPEIAVFAAHSGFIDRAAGPGWIATGDALIGFDPLTSSGIAGALNDALSTAETICAWLAGDDPAAAGAAYGRRANATMKRYLTERAAIYGQERRWPNSRFWQRRAG